MLNRAMDEIWLKAKYDRTAHSYESVGTNGCHSKRGRCRLQMGEREQTLIECSKLPLQSDTSFTIQKIDTKDLSKGPSRGLDVHIRKNSHISSDWSSDQP